VTHIKLLNLWPYPLAPEDLELVKQAKAALDLDVQLKPRGAVIGGEGRILALREPPPWITWDGYALVRDPENPGAMQAALRWAATSETDPRAVTQLGQLRGLLGGDVKELDPRQIARENMSKNLKLDRGIGVTFK